MAAMVSMGGHILSEYLMEKYAMFHTKHHIKIRQSWLQTTSRRQLKSFSVQQFFKNAAEVWASSPHLRSKSKLHHEIKQTSKNQSEESQLLLKSKGCNEIQGFRGNCDSQGKLGMCPSLAEPVSGGFPRSNFRMFHVKHFVATVPPEQLQDTCFPFQFHKAGRSCSPRLEKLSLFSPPPPCAKSMAHGFRCLRAAIRATRPEPRQHF
ncbi:MAG: hypothetical protein PUF96_03690 [Ruminococcus sp.]|nr:hypothetical protein [Ruminococcus sp.]